ncbi:MAG: type II toxin-antitoxin system MqsA family antitoxin [Pseudomonadota bacterium]
MTCIMCKGELTKGKVNFPVDRPPNFLLIKDVPAMVCEQCGEYFIDDGTAERIEEIVQRVKSSAVEIEVLRFAA